ncbi:TolB family protein [Embleya sp. AB8]|uniref:TolB family protein n=1 Tax=Embleya sp. AB8 TaxID=3156304 RepID=UPI003C723265
MRPIRYVIVLATTLGTCAALVPTASAAGEPGRHKSNIRCVRPGDNGHTIKDFAFDAQLSANGRYLAYRTTPIMGPDNPDPKPDAIFIKDLQSGATRQATVRPDGTPETNPLDFTYAFSQDGRYLAFATGLPNSPDPDVIETQIQVYDRETGRTELLLDHRPGSAERDPSISADGRYVAFTSTRNDLAPGADPARPPRQQTYVYVRDRRTGSIERAGVDSTGRQMSEPTSLPTISADGGRVGFQLAHIEKPPTLARPPQPVIHQNFYVHDRRTGRTDPAAIDLQGLPVDVDGASAVLSPDGRYAFFASSDDGIVVKPEHTNGSQIYERDLTTGATRRVSVAPDGSAGDGTSVEPGISANDQRLVFLSQAPNLVPGKTTYDYIPLARDLRTGHTERIAVADDGTPADGNADHPTTDATGHTVVFGSDATNLIPNQPQGSCDLYLRRLN